jgi:acetyl esterase/lipase
MGVVGRYVIRPMWALQKAQEHQQQRVGPPAGAVGPGALPVAGPSPVVSPARGPWRMPDLPELAGGTVIEPRVRFYEVHLPGSGGPGKPAMPGHSGKLWLYLPEGDHAPRSLPCVLIAGAGTNLMTGMDLGDADRPEHLPYARAGFAVLAYELDGMVPDPKPTDDSAFARYIRSFVDAEAGLVNMRVAVAFATTRVPSIDPERLYAAGHSSAATLALLVAENEPRIAACVAYAPVVDLRDVIPPDAQQIVARLVPGAGDLFTRFNPRVRESNLNCPLFLFVALDDDYAQQDRDFVQRLRSMGKNVTLGTVPSGGHHEPMIRNGIPAAIRWLKSLQPGEDGTLVPTKPAPTARPKTNPRRAPGKAVMPPSPGVRRPRANPGPG